MMRILTNTFITVLLFSSQLLLAQQEELHKADTKYDTHAYINAAEIYEEVAEAGFESEELLQKLGNSQYFNARYLEAVRYYGRLYELQPNQEAIYALRYAQALKASGEAQEAKKYFEAYTEASKGENSGKGLEIDFQELLDENSGRYGIEELKVNSAGRDYGAVTHPNGQVVFASTRDTGVIRRVLNTWDGLGFSDLYATQDPGSTAPPKKLKGDLNTRGHESTPVFTKDGKTVYFTRSRSGKGEGKDSSLGIYRAQLMNGNWTAGEDLSINSSDYSNAHPALNAEEDFLYFSSDKPGSYGQSDIYKVELFEDGSLGELVNLGNDINTIGRESFPFVSSDNLLYFSSDGHFGLGGLDIFYWDAQDSLTSHPINLGAPLNSPTDDFAFSLDPATGSGYFSSNRPEGEGHDDIYGFLEQEPIKQVHQVVVFGKVTDKETGQPLASSDISIIDSDNNKLTGLKTDPEGNYELKAARFSPFFVRAENETYYTDEKAGFAEKQMQEIDFQLEQDIFKIYKGEDLAKALGIERIYFDLDKAEIRPDAAVELEKVLAVMQKYPQVKIEVRSHTDSRASEAYNMKLSERRANATVDYLQKKGIASERMTSEGLGETQPENACADGIPCSEGQHQQNRRSEFIITEL